MQVLRINKLDLLPVLFRCYGTQRTHRNYYEILEVSPGCSQKEIRRAFLSLSKKWHPDIVGDKGHDKFVKLQEAYNVLSKEHTRREYDVNLKYNRYSPHSSSYTRTEYPSDFGRVYRSHREWEEHMARGNWQPPSSNKSSDAKKLRLLTWFAIFWIVLSLQMFFIQNRLYYTRRNLQYEYQNNYNLLRKNIQGLTLDEQNSLVQQRYDLAHGKNEEENDRQKEQ